MCSFFLNLLAAVVFLALSFLVPGFGGEFPRVGPGGAGASPGQFSYPRTRKSYTKPVFKRTWCGIDLGSAR